MYEDDKEFALQSRVMPLVSLKRLILETARQGSATDLSTLGSYFATRTIASGSNRAKALSPRFISSEASPAAAIL